MKVLLDACVTAQILPLLSSLDVTTARDRGWHELSNGNLLSVAQHEFDVLITLDRNMRYQQPIHKFNIGLVVIQGVRNTVESL